jgi:hypothetical protein
VEVAQRLEERQHKGLGLDVVGCTLHTSAELDDEGLGGMKCSEWSRGVPGLLPKSGITGWGKSKSKSRRSRVDNRVVVFGGYMRNNWWDDRWNNRLKTGWVLTNRNGWKHRPIIRRSLTAGSHQKNNINLPSRGTFNLPIYVSAGQLELICPTAPIGDHVHLVHSFSPLIYCMSSLCWSTVAICAS